MRSPTHPHRPSIALTIATAWLAVANPAVADVVIMNNGDRLTGDVVREDGGRLKLKTDYAGAIEIDWDQVRRVTLNEPTPVLLDDEQVVTVESVSHDGNRLTLGQPPPSQPMTVAAPQVKVIEPEPWELGQGHRLSGRVNIGLQNEQGNSPNRELDLDFELDYRRLRDQFESFGQLEYDTTRGVNTTQKWSLNNKYSRYFRGPWYAAAWLRLKHDRFADVRIRYLAGPALGYKWAERPGLNLRTEIGAIYLHEDFYDQGDTDAWGPGLFIDYDQELWNDLVQIYHLSMGYASVGAGDPNLWVSWTGLRMPMAGGIVGSLEYEIDYNSEPAPVTKTTDTTLRLKVGYQW